MQYKIRVRGGLLPDRKAYELAFAPEKEQCLVGLTYMPFETIRIHLRAASILPEYKNQNFVQIITEGKKVYGAAAATQFLGTITDANVDITGMIFQFHKHSAGKSVEIKGVPLAGLEEFMVTIHHGEGPRVMLKFHLDSSNITRRLE